MVYNIGWFSTGRGPGSRNLLKAIADTIARGEIKAQISFVFCSREQGEAEGSDLYLRMIRDYGFNQVTFSARRFKPEMRRQGMHNPEIMRQWRLEYDREVMARLAPYSAHIILLAGYMLIVGEEMCEKHNLINLHPAAPDGPAGTWQEVIWNLIEHRARESGVMMHLVTKELDKGPPVTYCTFSLRDTSINPLWERHEQELKEKHLSQIIKEKGEANPLFKEIRRRGAERELPLMVQTVKIFSEGTIGIQDKKVIMAGTVFQKPYCLNEAVERSIERMP